MRRDEYVARIKQTPGHVVGPPRREDHAPLRTSASSTLLSTSTCKTPTPHKQEPAGLSRGNQLIASASFSTPCHGPNVPTKPATTSSSESELSAASSPPTPRSKRSERQHHSD
jgi:hypothetical protein